MLNLIATSLKNWFVECDKLLWLPEHRYDQVLFPTTGQYDWFSGIVLYCLIRETRPQRIIEFSTSSGYSTCFSALALRANEQGVIETVDIDDHAITEAHQRWAELNVDKFVRFHHGDCKHIVPQLLEAGPVDVLFIDSLHSADMARWYLTKLIPKLRNTDLVHIHDVMPPEAQVRIHSGPPWPHLNGTHKLKQPLAYHIKRWLWHVMRGQRVPAAATSTYDVVNWGAVESDCNLKYFDGNYFDEARLLRSCLGPQSRDEVVYLHTVERSICEEYPYLQDYAGQDRIDRSLANHQPLEWNEVAWLRAKTLKDVSV